MNADQKKRIAHEISNWKNACNCRAVQLTGDRMAALLQEMTDTPEVEPVAKVTGYYGGYLSISTIDGRVLPAGTALYLAPPAPSVPDGWRIVPYTPTVQMLERAAYAVNNRPQPSKYEPSATPAIIFWTAMLNYAPEAVFINSCSKPQKLSDERILEIYEEAKANWNAQADQCNQWSDLGVDEVVTLVARAVEREILGGQVE